MFRGGVCLVAKGCDLQMQGMFQPCLSSVSAHHGSVYPVRITKLLRHFMFCYFLRCNDPFRCFLGDSAAVRFVDLLRLCKPVCFKTQLGTLHFPAHWHRVS